MICVVGMPGSGKGVFTEMGRKAGYSVIVLGDIVREETQKRGHSLEKAGEIAKILRKERGKAALAKLAVSRIVRPEKTVIDGIRAYKEVEEFSKYYDCYLVAIHASPQERFARLVQRGREDDPKTYEKFHERDLRELDFGLGNAIALADRMIINDRDIKTFRNICRKFFEERN